MIVYAQLVLEGTYIMKDIPLISDHVQRPNSASKVTMQAIRAEKTLPV